MFAVPLFRPRVERIVVTSIGECIKFYLAQLDFPSVRAFPRWISAISSYLEALMLFHRRAEKDIYVFRWC